MACFIVRQLRSVSYIVLFIYIIFGISSSQAHQMRLRLMTFNTWQSGFFVPNGLQYIADYILQLNPDVMALQELNQEGLDQLLQLLGPSWSAAQRKNVHYTDVAIISRQQINMSSIGQTDEFESPSVGCEISIRDAGGHKTISIWSLHSDYQDYGPYRICTPTALGRNALQPDEIHLAETNRVRGLLELTGNQVFRRHSEELRMPTFVLGDFNSPSHLDWIHETRDRHCNWTFSWPTSRMMEQFGFRDSFRDFRPDPLSEPGFTWSPTEKLMFDGRTPEPQDRIDFIYFKGADIYPRFVWEFSGFYGTWPSDHAAVIADFNLDV